MENLMYKDWKAENEAKIGMRFGEVKGSGLEHVELPLELSSVSTTTRQSSLVNGGEGAKDAEKEEEEVQQVSERAPTLPSRTTSAPRIRVTPQQRQGLHVPAAEEEGRGKRRTQAPNRLTYEAPGKPAKSALAGAALIVGDDVESDYDESAFAFFSPLEMPGEPATLKEALESSDAEEWKKATESELKSIEENGTWELVELPEGRNAITSKWLFKIKSDADGKIKSRLVAKGYQQKEKVDYKELFAPVVKPTTLRTLLARAAMKGWVVKQMDVTTAFLNGVLEEAIFMAQPEGFDDGSGRVLKLKKAFNGLKQAPRQWYLKLRVLHSLNARSLIEVMLKLQDKFKCKALGDVSFYLGLHIERDVEKRCMRVHQRKYLEALAANFGQSEGHVATPFPSGFKCVKGPEEESVGEEERRRFHSLVGSLMYAAVNTRPDVAFATGQLARVVQCLNEEQVVAGMRVAKYLGQTTIEANDVEEEEEEVQQVSERAPTLPSRTTSAPRIRVTPQQCQGLHVPAAEEEGRGKRRIQALNRLIYNALGKPAKSALAGAALIVGDDEESDYKECAFAFFSPVEMPGEPATLKEALESSDAEEWKKAMESELKSIEQNGTWELVELPEGCKAITSKWLFKIKSDADGKIERYKSRLVAKGYQQKEKVDYKELFAPVVKPTTLRTLLAGAAIKGWVVKQMDVTTAFLNGILEEEIFMAQPEGFDDGSGRVLRLKKALYGLKQAPRQWYLKLRGVLEEIGFTPSTADHSLFMLGEGEQRSFMVVYVDDILIFSPSSDLVKEVMLKLQNKFKCKALGDVSFYLGLHIERDVEKRCMRVHQRKYLEALAANFGQNEGHVATPFPSGFKCVKGPEEESVGEEERRRFHSLVGSLMYAEVNTQPDVEFATGQLARVVQCPNKEQVAAGMRVAKYLGQTPTVGLQYSAAAQRRQKGADGVEPGRLFLTAFSDASYASEPEDMTSVGGFISCVGGGPTAWESKKQVDQALSSVESEYMALFRAVREIVWQRCLLAELGEEQQGPTPLYGDSQGAIALAKNPVFHGLTKHMRVKWHWTRSMVAAGEVELHYVKTTRQPADMMTKRLVEQQHWKCCKLAGMALN
ncbi:unnamed protein product [Closterium sp. NIES-54]